MARGLTLMHVQEILSVMQFSISVRHFHIFGSVIHIKTMSENNTRKTWFLKYITDSVKSKNIRQYILKNSVTKCVQISLNYYFVFELCNSFREV